MKEVVIVDLFCGGGGATEGGVAACRELGLKPKLLGINHWDVAVKTYSRNHPDAEALCMNIDQVDPRRAVPGGKVHLLIAAPECTHHSTARGGKPINDQSRASAWLILRWCEALDVRSVLIENVPEFMSWGPLDSKGRPIKKLKGQVFLAFIRSLESLDYNVKYKVCNAADYGDPTTRKRLFILARKDRHPVEFPIPTHSKEGTTELFDHKEKWRGAREIIDWSLPGESIFNRKKPLSANTMRRIFSGLEKFSGGAFVVGAGGPRGHQRAKSVDDPLDPVVTTNHKAVVKPFLVSLRGTTKDAVQSSVRDVDEPTHTLTGGNHEYLAEPEFLLGQQIQGAPRSVNEPAMTITGDGAIGLVQPYLVTVDHTGTKSAAGHVAGVHSSDSPLTTITGKGRHAVVEPHIVSFHGGKSSKRRTLSVKNPPPTVDASNRFALAQAFLTKYYGTGENVVPLTVPMPTQTGKDKFGLVIPTLDGDLILDIRFRMLQPHELAAAMSFAPDYVFEGTKEQKVKQIGNAWAVRMGAALAREQLKWFVPKTR